MELVCDTMIVVGFRCVLNGPDSLLDFYEAMMHIFVFAATPAWTVERNSLTTLWLATS